MDAPRLSAPPLDHGAVGNGRVLALISPTTAVEWLCLPRFDAPSVFGRLLDAAKGGTFRFLSDGREIRGRQEYLRNTNVLRTVVDDGADAFEVVDYAPRLPDGFGVRAPISLRRLVRPLRGRPKLVVDFDPRPDYARGEPTFVETAEGVAVFGGASPLSLTTDAPLPFVLGRRPIVLDRPLRFDVSHGRPDRPLDPAAFDRDLELTVEGWRAWAKSCALPVFEPEAVLRSALCLKLHAFHDTGAIIAAATTSVPEAMDTARTWDYRFCWLRDAAFVVEALRRLSHLAEGERFLGYLRDVAESGPLQPVYAVDGSRDLEERFLPHLAGFGGNGHVRIGNAAALQQQNDLYGELILCLSTLLSDPRLAHLPREGFLPLIERLVEDAIAAAPTDDMGIWEFRTMLRPYAFSRAMCWAAIEHGARLARLLGRPDLADRWQPIADAERETVLRRAYNAELGFFTQGLDGVNPDAANLLFAPMGLVDGRDPRFVSTVEKYGERLMERGLMLRYRNPDDLGAPTSAFTICSFWYVEALALVGRLDDAQAEFRKLLRFANPVGLFSEDVDPDSGALLGNFPQAYTHVGLINAAATIGGLLEARDGRIRTWA